MMSTTIQNYLKNITLPQTDSHKGQNGKLLIIGGSNLFHAASKWSLDVASKFVDMTFYALVPSNNQLVEAAKGEFWNGMVIERKELENYLEEADAVLIGPGMKRSDFAQKDFTTPPTEQEWQEDTQKIVNYLLHKNPEKKWVVDAGALQMVEPSLLTPTVIVTPHHQELQRLIGNFERSVERENRVERSDQVDRAAEQGADRKNMTESESIKKLLEKGITILLKGPKDFIYRGDEVVEVTGGNAGMTKGGTGDVLAGLVAALYTRHDAMTAAVVGSYINKRAGENLFESVGPFFNSSDLVNEVPKVLWEELRSLHNLQK